MRDVLPRRIIILNNDHIRRVRGEKPGYCIVVVCVKQYNIYSWPLSIQYEIYVDNEISQVYILYDTMNDV